MPHTIIMQGVSTIFAAIMTVTVISFPTPNDLRDALTSGENDRDLKLEPGGIAPILPEPINTVTSVGEVERQLQACADSLSSTVPYELQTCRDTLILTRSMVEDRPFDAELSAKLELTTALFCRVNWVETATKGETFDVQRCKDLEVGLAE